MKPFNTYVFTLLFGCSLFSLNAQFSFVDMTDSLLVKNQVSSGVALGIADLNGDGLDDIARLDSTNILNIEFQQGSGQKFEHYKYGLVTQSDEWALTIGDVNNDGYNDIMTGGAYNSIKLLTYNKVMIKQHFLIAQFSYKEPILQISIMMAG